MYSTFVLTLVMIFLFAMIYYNELVYNAFLKSAPVILFAIYAIFSVFILANYASYYYNPLIKSYNLVSWIIISIAYMGLMLYSPFYIPFYNQPYGSKPVWSI